MSQLKTLIKNLGPGLLFASMAIGTSHLVLSTKGGAQYGWVMVIPIILANVLKYPFFEFGIRYTSVTQKSLIQGYLNMGKGYLWIYAFITLISTFTILAALYVVTSGLFINLFQIEADIGLVAFGLFVFISALLIIGKYQFLEDSLKAVISILFLALLVTTVMVIHKGPVADTTNYVAPEIFNEVGILFLISLMGWMPTAVEASGWVSLWTIENQNTMKSKPTLKMALQEFNVGYFMTALLAIFFLVIGWMTLYGTGTELSGNAVVFADQVVGLFTTHIGNWAYILIAVAAFATMFSTCMTAHDAVSRVSLDVLDKLFSKTSAFRHKNAFSYTVLFMALVNWVVIAAFGAHMGNLVALATFVSFVMAPLIGWMNLKAVLGKDIPKEFKPKKGLQALTYVGMVFLSLFALYYCWMLLT
ncbi:NRAMP family divalent metal transporter [Flagellimonas allohymeniacidonis]|uniref:Divalent metal cation transporter n=1 Tax=Flagellimonas allohymeniacidonis TaxID=2517819 RepID=A0A4Q8QC64_9FLAO|nr:divalent metal cation transporter [Allomuricauda hymeniacidonis]TAI47007.1 divalent metal cation transporter [Allomuricauda hymeniacidonis]